MKLSNDTYSDPQEELNIQKALFDLKDKIAKAAQSANRAKEDILLLAVSKRVPTNTILSAIKAGQQVFGENHVQEAEKKITALKNIVVEAGASPRFHLVGPLQRNKAKKAVQLFDMIQTVDTIELAQEIALRADQHGKQQDILIQVNISTESTKSGVMPERLTELTEQILLMKSLTLCGLMTIGSAFDGTLAQTSKIQGEFKKMRELKAQIETKFGVKLQHLSMGMSADFELAIKEGATIVRIGTAIFGQR